jgi:hypothetical protein
MAGLAILLTLTLATPLPGHLTYACAGSSDMLRNPWAVWTMIANRQCKVTAAADPQGTP